MPGRETELVDWLRDAAPAFGIGRSGREIKARLTEAASQLEQPRLTEDEKKRLLGIAGELELAVDEQTIHADWGMRDARFLRNLAGDNQ